MRMKKSHSVKTYTVIVLVFVISIMVFGVSVSYSFFNLQVSGSADTGRNETPPFEVTTTLNDASVIDSAELALIDGADYLTKAESVSFSVTNSPSSAVSAKYTIDLVEMSLSKNLASKYFKWAIVVNGTETYTGDFVDESVSEFLARAPYHVSDPVIFGRTSVNDRYVDMHVATA